jgi:hypothetical protein
LCGQVVKWLSGKVVKWEEGRAGWDFLDFLIGGRGRPKKNAAGGVQGRDLCRMAFRGTKVPHWCDMGQSPLRYKGGILWQCGARI